MSNEGCAKRACSSNTTLHQTRLRVHQLPSAWIRPEAGTELRQGLGQKRAQQRTDPSTSSLYTLFQDKNFIDKVFTLFSF